MRIASSLFDDRIKAHNLLIDISIGDFLSLAEDVIDKNIYQRKRLRSGKTVYALLRSDLSNGCIIPPIVMALTSNSDGVLPKDEEIRDFLFKAKDHLVILDGIQRTHTIIDMVGEIERSGDEDRLKDALSKLIRVEFYVGINRIGILYRMLTLNTGQSPMSLRQQIEMLYLDYLNEPIGEIELIRESDDKRATAQNQYNFKDVVDGFNSYLDRDELPIEKSDILENIRSLEKLSEENQETDLFQGYVTSLNRFVLKMNSLCNGAEVSQEFIDTKGKPFGASSNQIFKKSQAMSGFGAAIGKLKDRDILSDSFEDTIKIVDNISMGDPQEFLETINGSLLWIKENASKIGNAQREFFLYFFRSLLNKDDDSYLNPTAAAVAALRKYKSMYA